MKAIMWHGQNTSSLVSTFPCVHFLDHLFKWILVQTKNKWHVFIIHVGLFPVTNDALTADVVASCKNSQVTPDVTCTFKNRCGEERKASAAVNIIYGMFQCFSKVLSTIDGFVWLCIHIAIDSNFPLWRFALWISFVCFVYYSWKWLNQKSDLLSNLPNFQLISDMLCFLCYIYNKC